MANWNILSNSLYQKFYKTINQVQQYSVYKDKLTITETDYIYLNLIQITSNLVL